MLGLDRATSVAFLGDFKTAEDFLDLPGVRRCHRILDRGVNSASGARFRERACTPSQLECGRGD